MILYLDSSSPSLNIALISEENVISKEIEREGDTSLIALDEINQLLKSENITLNDLNKIILVNGPGSYTGTRICTTIAKTISFCLNIPVIEVSSLEVIALSSKEPVVAFIDARRSNVWALAKEGDKNVLEEQFISFSEVLERFNPQIWHYATNKKTSIIDNYELIKPNYRLISETFKNKEATPAHLIDVNYLKKTEAEENHDKRNQN